MTIMELVPLARFGRRAEHMKTRRTDRKKVIANLNKIAKYRKSAKGRLLSKKRGNKKAR